MIEGWVSGGVTWWKALAVGVMAAFGTAAGVGLFRGWALRRGIVARPGSQSAHSGRVPKGAGLVISVISCAALVLLWRFQPGVQGAATLAFVAGALIVTSVSWVDDLRPLQWYPRLVAHAVAAGLLIWASGFWRVVALPFVPRVDLGWVGAVVTFLWVVGFTNAFNFMDGIDGIAGGQAVLAGLSWLLLAGFEAPLGGWLALLLAAASLGFLVHNRHPARVLMGDAGSIFLGFSLSAVGVLEASHGPRLPLVGVLLVWPFVFDTCFTLLRRLYKGENILRPHRSHLYQRLVAAGYGHTQVSVLYVVLAGFGTLLAWLWIHLARPSVLVAGGLATLALALWLMTILAERSARRPLSGLEEARSGGAQRPS